MLRLSSPLSPLKRRHIFPMMFFYCGDSSPDDFTTRESHGAFKRPDIQRRDRPGSMKRRRSRRRARGSLTHLLTQSREKKGRRVRYSASGENNKVSKLSFFRHSAFPVVARLASAVPMLQHRFPLLFATRTTTTTFNLINVYHRIGPKIRRKRGTNRMKQTGLRRLYR